jgi:hypothetical protein
MRGEVVKFPNVDKPQHPATGSAGLRTQVPGGIASVSNLARATGEISPGGIVQTDSK